MLVRKGRFSNQWTQIQGRHILYEPEIDQEKQSSERWLKLILHHLWTHLWQFWLARKDEQERKRLEKLHLRVIALYSKVDLLLACDKPIFELPILERMTQHSRELETWVRLVTPTVLSLPPSSEPSKTPPSTFAAPITTSSTSSLLQDQIH